MAGRNKPEQARGTNAATARASRNLGAGGGQSDDAPDACDLTIDVDLEGVRAGALTNLNIGDALHLELVQAESYPVIICKKQDGVIVGSLAAFLSITQLVKCLQMGVSYDVRVVHLSNGTCHVFGQRKSR